MIEPTLVCDYLFDCLFETHDT